MVDVCKRKNNQDTDSFQNHTELEGKQHCAGLWNCLLTADVGHWKALCWSLSSQVLLVMTPHSVSCIAERRLSIWFDAIDLQLFTSFHIFLFWILIIKLSIQNCKALTSALWEFTSKHFFSSLAANQQKHRRWMPEMYACGRNFLSFHACFWETAEQRRRQTPGIF